MKDVTPGKKLDNAFLKHSKTAMILVAVLVAIGIGYNVWAYVHEQKALAAQADLFKAEQTYEKTLMDAQKKEAPEKDAKADPKKKPEVVRPADVDFTAAIELYKKVISTHPKTEAAQLAAHGLSSIYVEKKKYQEALDVLKQVADKKQKGLIAAFTNLKLAGLYEKVGQCQEAITVLNDVAADGSQAYMKPEVLLKTGLCYEKLGQLDKAKEVYTQITTEYAGTPTSQDAEKYLKLLSLAGKS